MGALSDLMEVQESFRGILRQIQETPDKSMAEAMAMGTGLNEDSFVAIACIAHEMGLKDDPVRGPSINDLLYAIEVVDHLDTLGMEVRHKE